MKTKIVSLMLMLVLVSAACSGTGKISGEAFLKAEDGKKLPVAGMDLALIQGNVKEAVMNLAEELSSGREDWVVKGSQKLNEELAFEILLRKIYFSEKQHNHNQEEVKRFQEEVRVRNDELKKFQEEAIGIKDELMGREKKIGVYQDKANEIEELFWKEFSESDFLKTLSPEERAAFEQEDRKNDQIRNELTHREFDRKQKEIKKIEEEIKQRQALVKQSQEMVDRYSYLFKLFSSYRQDDKLLAEEIKQTLEKTDERSKSLLAWTETFPVNVDFAEKSKKLFQEATVSTLKVSDKGTFSFKEIEKGKYFLMGSFDVKNQSLFWFQPVSLKGKEVSVILDHDTARPGVLNETQIFHIFEKKESPKVINGY